MKKLKKVMVLAGLMLLVVGCSNKDASNSSVKAEDIANYPEKEIRLLVAYAPGGQSDLIARKIADVIVKGELLSQPIVVTNISGGNTNDAINALANAEPDGYTYLLHHSGLITSYAMGSVSTNYDELDVSGGIISQSFAMVKRSDDDRWADGAELVAHIKANPGEVTVGFPGYGGAGHFALLQFLKANSIEGMVKEVPYPGGSEAITAHLGGHVDLRATNMGDSARYVNSGEVGFLCMISKDRNPYFPDVMSLTDMGAEPNEMVLRTGIFAPKGTPDELEEAFMAVVNTAVETEEFKSFAADMANAVEIASGADFAATYEKDLQDFKAIAESLMSK